jgi:HrpA-like RNA helicase
MGEFGGVVLCTQPRRLAVVAVASRVAEELHQVVGKGIVGLAIGRQVRISKDTRIVFSTAGCIVEELRSKGEAALRQYSVVVIDEVHERSIENELLITSVKVGWLEPPTLACSTHSPLG